MPFGLSDCFSALIAVVSELATRSAALVVIQHRGSARHGRFGCRVLPRPLERVDITVCIPMEEEL